MAISRFSTPVQLSAPQGVVDHSMLDTAIGYKDAKIDQGYSLVNQAVSALNTLPTGRDQDTEYKNKKVRDLVETINGYGNVDLSNPRVLAQLKLEAETAASDPKLISMVKSAKNKIQYEETLLKMKQSPKMFDKLSAINEYEDRRLMREWESGKIDYNPINTPTLYTDIDKIGSESLKNMAPKAYSYVDGLHIVDKEIRTESDLVTSLMGTASNNANVMSQLGMNARYVYRDKTPEQVKGLAVQSLSESIDESKQSILTYETALKNAGVTTDEKASIKSRMEELSGEILKAEGRLNTLRSRTISEQEADEFKINMYTKTWASSVAKPMIVDKTKLRADTVGLSKMNIQSKVDLENTRMAFTASQNDQDRKLSWEKTLLDTQTQYAKMGLKTDPQTGEVLPGGSIGGTFQETALQAENGDKVLGETNDVINNLYATNKNIITQATIDLVRASDPTLAGQLDKIYKANGNISDYKGEMSEAQIKLLADHDKLLLDSTDPQKMRDNPTLSQYGAVSNTITENLLKAESLKKAKDISIKEVYEEAKKDGYKGDHKSFEKEMIEGQKAADEKYKELLKDTNHYNAYSRGGFSMNSPEFSGGYRNITSKYHKNFNDKMLSTGTLNQFYTSRAIGEDDKDYNKGEGAGRIFQLAQQSGITVDGKVYGINQKIANNTAVRDSKDNVVGMRVIKYTPYKDEVQVQLRVTGEDGKEVNGDIGTLRLNPSQMKTAFGVNSSDQVTSVHELLTDGVMVSPDKKPMYFNLNGLVPNMNSNVKYRFFDGGGGRDVGVSILLPNGQEKHLPQRWSQERSRFLVEDALSKMYVQTLSQINSDPSNKDLSNIEKEKLALTAFYENLNKNK